MHKTANVLNKLAKSVKPRAKQHLQDIWMAEIIQGAKFRDGEKLTELVAYNLRHQLLTILQIGSVYAMI
jgi:hypothetical protein